MKKIKMFACFFVCLYVMATFIPFACAKTSIAASYLVEKGTENYEKGDISSAIHHLSEALLIDPENETAREYLSEIGIDEGLYDHKLPPVAKVAALAQEVNSYKGKVVDLESKNRQQKAVSEKLNIENLALVHTVNDQYDEIGGLNIKIDLVREATQRQNELVKRKVEDLALDSYDQKRQIELYGRISDKHLDIIDHNDNLVIKKDDEIMELKDEVQLTKVLSMENIVDYENKLDETSSNYETEVAYLREELGRYKTKYNRKVQREENEMKALENLIKSHEDRIADLNDAMLVRDMELVKKDKMLFEEKTRSVQANKQLAYARHDLKEKENMGRIFAVGAEDRLDASKDLIIQKDRTIAELKEKLAKVMNQLKSLEDTSSWAGQDGEVVALKNQIKEIKRQLFEKESSLQAKDNDFDILEERLKDAQERLNLVQRIVEEKDEEINALKNEVIQMRDQCVR